MRIVKGENIDAFAKNGELTKEYAKPIITAVNLLLGGLWCQVIALIIFISGLTGAIKIDELAFVTLMIVSTTMGGLLLFAGAAYHKVCKKMLDHISEKG